MAKSGRRSGTATRRTSLFVALLLGPVLLLALAGSGCNALLGIDEHALAAGDAAPAGSTSDGSTSDGSTSGGSTSGASADASGDVAVTSITDGQMTSEAGTNRDGATTSGPEGGGSDSATATKPGADAGSGGDAAAVGDAAAGAEAGPGGDAGVCDPSAPFTSITMVGGLPGGAELHGRLSPDEKTIWFDTNEGTLYVGTRSSLGAAFAYAGLGAGGAAISFTGNDIYPTVTDDLKTLYFLNGDSNLLTEATRADTSQLFVSDGGALPIASPPGAQYRAAIVVGSTLYYGLFASGLSGSEIDFSNIAGQTFSAPQAVNGFPLAGVTDGVDGERFPVASRDGLTMYFRDAVFIDSGVGQVGEIYVTQRARTSDPFVNSRVVQELNTELGEEPLWLSVDQCRLYFMSFRNPEGIYVGSHS